MFTSGLPRVRPRHLFRIALFGAAVVAPLAVAAGVTMWPGQEWHSGPIGKDLEQELISRVNAPILVAARASADSEDAVTAARESEARPAIVKQTLTVAPGDTLMGLFVDAGIGRREAYDAITALRDVFQPRDLRIGQNIELSLATASGSATEGSGPEQRLIAFGLQPSVERDVRVSRNGGSGFQALSIDRPLEQRSVGVRGTIESNLSLASQKAGLPMKVLAELIRMYSFDVDFQRDLRRGDSFEVIYDAMFEQDGLLARPDDILYAAMTLSGKRIELYRFAPKDGTADYYDPKGDSVRKTLMRTPIDGGRLSSGFGMRKHPVLGYSKMHRGVDFAAPRGTPIYAAGDGVLELAGRNGSYGKYVRIRHNSTYKTAYAHMSRIKKGMRKGKRVSQGQVIGYVGTTGRSTGPHLHYEVLVNGRQISPRKVKLPSGEKLKGKKLEAFNARRTEIDVLRAEALGGEALMVNAGCVPMADDGSSAAELSADCARPDTQ